nr:HAD-IIB family hydrolase [Aminobacter sp. HY435]
MLPLDQLDPASLRSVRFLLSDIDDTITTDGRLPAAAYMALERLQQAGVSVIPVTGRPAGWCDHIARMWPVAGVIGENGALYFQYCSKQRRMLQRYWTDEASRRANRVRLDALAQEILAEVDGAGLASDQPYRVADLAIDYCEDVARLSDAAVRSIVSLFEAAGAQARVSSIHVNGWFGEYDKLSMSRAVLADEFSCPPTEQSAVVAFTGDSPNDEPMFGAFPLSIGVANVLDFNSQIADKPKFVTDGHSGDGFVEFAERLLAAKLG